MRTIIAIIVPIPNVDKVPAIKDEIVGYLGKRLVSYVPENIAAVEVRGTLSNPDRAAVGDIVRQFDGDAATLIIETDVELDDKIVTLIPKPKPDGTISGNDFIPD